MALTPKKGHITVKSVKSKISFLQVVKLNCGLIAWTFKAMFKTAGIQILSNRYIYNIYNINSYVFNLKIQIRWNNKKENYKIPSFKLKKKKKRKEIILQHLCNIINSKIWKNVEEV